MTLERNKVEVLFRTEGAWQFFNGQFVGADAYERKAFRHLMVATAFSAMEIVPCNTDKDRNTCANR